MYYFPFFYGRQFELLAIRDFSTQVSPSHIFPIIEPVKNNINSLKLACDALVEQNFNFIVITNPSCGELKNTDLVDKFLEEHYAHSIQCYKGIFITGNTTIDEIYRRLQNPNFKYFFIHDEACNDFSGFLNLLSQADQKIAGHIFFKKNIPDIKIFKIKQRKDAGLHFVSLQDGFNKMRNADYPAVEFFSDQHIACTCQNLFTDFSDYLIAGREYSETGGPAYAVAIHLTFFDSTDDDIMKIFHFVSNSTGTSENPAGKFSEALDKMCDTIGAPPPGVTLNSLAIQEFLRLHETQHYPGLGFLKKLSMLHHVQIINQYLDNR